MQSTKPSNASRSFPRETELTGRSQKSLSRLRRSGCALSLWLAALPACSREANGPSEHVPSATPTQVRSSAPTGVSAQPTVSPIAAIAPKTPELPPQFVACGKLEFHRITDAALQSFEVAAVIPPPTIRGSRVARQVGQVDIEAPTNVVALGQERFLVIAERTLLEKAKGSEVFRHAPIDVRPPLHAWPDGKRGRVFWVRSAGERTLDQYTLGPARGEAPKVGYPVTRGPVEEPDGFDARLFAPGADVHAYSTKEGLRTSRAGSKLAPFPALKGRPVALFPDATEGRFWSGDEGGQLSLWLGEAWAPAQEVPGVIIDAAVEGTRVAVLSVALDKNVYQPTVSVFENGEPKHRLKLGPTFVPAPPPKLDLCIIPGRPWVVVGGKRWLQLLDWSAPRLLAEW